jgi:hypothetical protein
MQSPVRFYTVHQVAQMTQLSTHRIYEIIRQRLLPAVHICLQIRVEEQALRNWAGISLVGGSPTHAEVALSKEVA